MPDSMPEEALGPVRSVTGGRGSREAPRSSRRGPRGGAEASGVRQALRGLRPAGDARAVRGPGLPLPERPEDLTGGQGTALAGSRGRGRRCGAATCSRRGCARCSAPMPPTRRASSADGSRGRSRCRTPALAGLSREAGRRREGIPGSTGVGVPDARVWAASDKARVATGRGHGSHDIDNPMALVMPGCSDLRPTPPGRAVVT